MEPKEPKLESGQNTMPCRAAKLRRIYTQPAFVICAAVLATAASTMPAVLKGFKVVLSKEPFPLKKPLHLLDAESLAPYKIISRSEIENEDIIKSLGTEDYIEWVLEDPDTANDSAIRYCLLFVTYYELADRVPHVPEECYFGSGYQLAASDSVTFEIDMDGKGARKEIPARYLVFIRTNANYGGKESRFSVMYLFNVNKTYANTRENARIILNKNIFTRYSYFTKVEWKFFNEKFGSKINPDKEEAVPASQKLLSIILPVLEREHWPDIRQQ